MGRARLNPAIMKDVVRDYQFVEETGAIITAEENSVIGGLGSAIAEVVTESYPVSVERVGIPDTFCVTGPDPESLLDHYKMSMEDIIKKTKIAIGKKKKLLTCGKKE